MGIFDKRPFDFDHDGEEDPIETMVGLQMFAGSRREAIELTGDDTFYIGNDSDDDIDDEDNGFHDEFEDTEDYDDADEYDNEDPDDNDDWD
jgi:hypothetical protein